MIRVVIDTNSLPRDVSVPSAAFQRAATLVSEGVLRVIFPHVVAEEWRTQQLEHTRKHLQKIGAALRDVTSTGHLQGHAQLQQLQATAAAVPLVLNDLEALSQAALQRLLQQLQAEVVPVNGAHGARVLAAYFGGQPAFNGVKNRQDFPDAFVFETVRDLVGAPPNNALSVITADANLGKHVATVAGVTRYESLDGFVASEAVQQAAAEIQLEADWAAALPDVLTRVRALEAELRTDAFFQALINALHGTEVDHHSLPSDGGEATIQFVSDPDDLEFEWDEAESYGPRLLRVPFSCNCDVSLSMAVYYADAYGLGGHFSVRYTDPEDTAFFDVQAEATADVRGYALITTSDWPNDISEETTEIGLDTIEGVVLVEDAKGSVV
jgi:hypothetical protein